MKFEFQRAIVNGRIVTNDRPAGFAVDELALAEIVLDGVPGTKKGELFVGRLNGTISNATFELIQRVNEAEPLPRSIHIKDTRCLRFAGFANKVIDQGVIQPGGMTRESNSDQPSLDLTYCAGNRPELGALHEQLLVSGGEIAERIRRAEGDMSPWCSCPYLLDEMPLAERMAIILFKFDWMMMNNGFWLMVSNLHAFSRHFIFELEEFMKRPDVASDPYAAKLAPIIARSAEALDKNARFTNTKLFFHCAGRRFPHYFELRLGQVEYDSLYSGYAKSILPDEPILDESIGNEAEAEYYKLAKEERIHGMERILNIAFGPKYPSTSSNAGIWSE